MKSFVRFITLLVLGLSITLILAACNKEETPPDEYDETPETFVITFICDFNTPIENNFLVVDENSTLETPTLENDNYEFLGWYLEQTFQTRWDSQTNLVTADTHLFARWHRLVTITFDFNGGTSTSPETILVRQGYTFELPVVTKAGYSLINWTNPLPELIASANATIFANWSNNQERADVVIAAINEIPAVSALIVADRFLVWDVRDLFNALNDAEQALVTNLANLLAAESRIATIINLQYFTISFDTGGLLDIESLTLREDVTIVLPTPVVFGHEFLGWYFDDEFTLPFNITRFSELRANEIGVPVPLNFTIFARLYNVDALANLIREKIADLPSISDITLDDLEQVQYIRTFIQNTNPLAQRYIHNIDILLMAENKLSILLGEGLETFTVQLIIVEDELENTTLETITIMQQLPIILLPTPTKDGYTFVGWFTQEASGTQIVAPFVPLSDMTLFAHWTRIIPDQEIANAVINMINNLPQNLTNTAGRNALANARAAWVNLTVDQQALVSNIDVLDTAEVTSVINMITALPSNLTNTAGRTALANARSAWSTLTVEQQTLVSNIDVLDAAEVTSVINMIAALPTNLTNSAGRTAINNARQAWMGLTAIQQQLVSNITTLNTAEETSAANVANRRIVLNFNDDRDEQIIRLFDNAFIHHRLPLLERAGYIFMGWFEDDNTFTTPARARRGTTGADLHFFAWWLSDDEYFRRPVETIYSSIASLPKLDDLSLSDQTPLQQIRLAVGLLNYEQHQLLVELNYDDLLLAEAKMIVLISNDQVAYVVNLINNLPSVAKLAITDYNLVVAARMAYDQLSIEQQMSVSNYNTLITLEERLIDISYLRYFTATHHSAVGSDGLTILSREDMFLALTPAPTGGTANQHTFLGWYIAELQLVDEVEILVSTGILLTENLRLTANIDLIASWELNQDRADIVIALIENLPSHDETRYFHAEQIRLAGEMFYALNTAQRALINPSLQTRLNNAVERIEVVVLLVYYTIEFDTFGHGNFVDNIIIREDLLFQLPIVSADGLVFVGWFLDPEFLNPLTAMRVSQDTRLFALWSAEIQGVHVNLTSDGARISWDYIDGVSQYIITYFWNGDLRTQTLHSNTYIVTHGAGIISNMVLSFESQATPFQSTDILPAITINELSILEAAFANMELYQGIMVHSFGESSGTAAGILTVGGLYIINRDQNLVNHEVFRYSFSRANTHTSQIIASASNLATRVQRTYHNATSNNILHTTVTPSGVQDRRNLVITEPLIPNWLQVNNITITSGSFTTSEFNSRFARDPFRLFLYTVNQSTIDTIHQSLTYQNGLFSFSFDMNPSSSTILNGPEIAFVSGQNFRHYSSLRLTFVVDSNMRLVSYVSSAVYYVRADGIGGIAGDQRTIVTSTFTITHSNTPFTQFIFNNPNTNTNIDLTWRG